jgi:hypothetical protein
VEKAVETLWTGIPKANGFPTLAQGIDYPPPYVESKYVA